MSERFWAAEGFADRTGRQELDTLSFLHTPDGDFRVWWTAYPVRAPLLVAWAGGPRARALAGLTRAEIERRACAALARHTGLTARRIRAMVRRTWMHDWQQDPFARGAYSYPLVGGVDAPAVLARPVTRTIFFAGEATDVEGATGTVHGAIASGRRAARQVQRALG
jgi:monoamine oxidase